MFKTKTTKFAALLLVAPLLSAPLLAPAVAHADDGKSFSPAETVKILKKWKTWASADGDVYVFDSDGIFSYRRGKESAQGETYVTDSGRFTVKERGYEPADFDTSINMLHLRISRSRRKSDGKLVKRNDTATIGIGVIFSSKKGGKSKPSLRLGGSEGMRLY